MRPIELTLDGFGSYQTPTTIYFTPQDDPEKNAPNADLNLFLVSGATGSGKTTIFDAITFALYGEVSADKNRTGLDLMSRDGTDPKKPPKGRNKSKKATVRFVFDVGQGSARRRYTITRSIKRTSSNGAWITAPEVCLERPGEAPVEKVGPVEAEVIKTIGLNAEQFKLLAMLAQGEFMRLLNTSSRDRIKMFRTLFGTEKFEQIELALKARNQQCEEKLKQRWGAVQSICGRVSVPDNLPNHDTLLALQEEIGSASSPLPHACDSMLSELAALVEEESQAAREIGKTVNTLDEQTKSAASQL